MNTGLGIQDIIGSHRDAILAAAERRGATNVRVFGSVARAEAHADSDVDLLVDFARPYRILSHIGLTMDIQAILGRRVDVAVADNLREELKAAVLQDAVPL